MNLFTLFGTIAIDASNSKETIDNITNSAKTLKENLETTSSGADQTAKHLSNNSKLGTSSVFLGNMLSSVAAAGVQFLMKLPGAAIEAAASVDAEVSAFKTTFGEMADAATESYSRISSETNILETRLRSVGTKGYAQLKGAGFDANNALSMSEQLLRLAADAAAYYDISLEDVDTRLRSFMRGNTEAGDAIGLFTSESQRNTAALELYDQKWLDLNEAQRQYLLLDVANKIYEDTGVIGQAAREGTEWANVVANMSEAKTQSIATIGSPIKDSLLPALNELSNWLANNETQTKLSGLAEALGKLSGMVFDGMLKAFEWMLDNGEAVSVGLKAISVALIAGAVAAHPYAAAITAIVAGFALLKRESEGLATGANYDKMFDKFSDADLQTLQAYVDAVNAAREAEEAYANSDFSDEAGAIWEAALAKQQEAFNAANAIDGLISTYNSWRSGQAVNQGKDLYLDVPLRASDDSASGLQATVEGYELEGQASINASPDTHSLIQAALDAMNFNAKVNVLPRLRTDMFSTIGIPGFASGIDRVPRDMLAIIHKDEAVLRASEAAVYRGEKKNQSEKRNGRENNSGNVINVTQNIHATPMTPSELAAQTKFALGMMRFSV